jgi:plastocyanin
MRVIAPAAATAALLAVPTAAHATVNRNIQAFDQAIGFAPVWTPNAITAQPGDTITWHFDEPGNPNAVGASHDLYLVRPGQADERLSASYLGPTVEATLNDAGTYSFYCSIHRDSMRGTIEVAAGDPTPAIDPGHPWESPAPPIVTTTSGPPPLLNSATPLTVLEAGDTTAPTLRLRKVTSTRRVARARVEVSEAGTIYARVMRGTKVVSTGHLTVKGAGTSTVSVRLPKRRAHYRIAVFIRDFSKLESKLRSARL